MLIVIVPVWVRLPPPLSPLSPLSLGLVSRPYTDVDQSTEKAPFTSRGQFISIKFFLNIFGVVVAYWLELQASFLIYIIRPPRLAEDCGCSHVGGGYSPFVWRFPIAFQIIPLIFLLVIVFFVPESPRWLVKIGREDEARYILGRLRGKTGNNDLAEAEFQDIRNTAALEKKTAGSNSYFHMFWKVMLKVIGGGSSVSLHIGRRVQLVI